MSSVYNIENYLDFNREVGLHDTLNTTFFEELRALPLWRVVSTKGRMLDDISKSLYDTELLWWALQYYNSILDPLDFDDLSIEAPDKSDLEDLLIRYKVLRANSQ